MKYKKIFLSFFTILLFVILVGCDNSSNKCEHIDENEDGKCDKCSIVVGTCKHIDSDTDNLCDKCATVLEIVCIHIDENEDGKCDKCNIVVGTCKHIDSDTDNLCDKCGTVLETVCIHIDENEDGKCDKCNIVVGTCKHIDSDTDNLCDKCGTVLETVCIHIDENEDGKCDKCSIVVGTCKHTDINNNGDCDKCEIDVIVDFNLFGINDMHGKFLDSNSQPGVDELTTYLFDAYKNKENTIVFSSGDMWQGSAEAGLTYGKIITEWMNYLDFSFMTLGNHEFDWSDSAIKENELLAEFPFLAINVYDIETNQIAEFCKSSIMIDLGEIQIGFIGAIGDCYSSISGEMSAGYYFKTGSELSSLVKEESNKLRNSGADFIVYSIHDGSSYSSNYPVEVYDEEIEDYYDISLSDGYVDLVFEGHSHTSYIQIDSKGVYHIQGGGENSGLSHISVAYNYVNNEYSLTSCEIIKNHIYSEYEKDDIVDELMEKYSEETAILTKKLGNNESYKSSSDLRNTVAGLYLETGLSKWSNYDIVLGGGYLSCRAPSSLESGEVDYSMLYMLFPFNNRIALCSIDGATLLKQFINSTNSNYFLAYSEFGTNVKNNINPYQTYYIITDSYNYTYAPSKLTVVEYYDEGIYARDLLATYIENGGYEKTTSSLLADVYYTNKELIEYGKKLSSNEVTTDKYYAIGTITEISNTMYGNMKVVDSSGYYITLYGTYDDAGNRFDSMTKQPAVGDKILIYGVLKRYVSNTSVEIIEFINATISSDIKYLDDGVSISLPMAIFVSYQLDANVNSDIKYSISGTISQIVDVTSGNLYVKDDVGNEFYIYKANLTNIVQVGDTLILNGYLRKYVNSYGTEIYEMYHPDVINN